MKHSTEFLWQGDKPANEIGGINQETFMHAILERLDSINDGIIQLIDKLGEK